MVNEPIVEYIFENIWFVECVSWSDRQLLVVEFQPRSF